jgi:hypothetical protein
MQHVAAGISWRNGTAAQFFLATTLQACFRLPVARPHWLHLTGHVIAEITLEGPSRSGRGSVLERINIECADVRAT